MPQLLPAAAAEAAMAAAPAIAGEAALGASGLAALPSIVSPAVAGIGAGASALGAGALEAGLATGLSTMGGLSGLATLAPGVSAAANLLGMAAPALETAVPAFTSSLASAAPGVASAVGEAASGLGAAGVTGLQSLGNVAGFNPAGFVQPAMQTANMLNPVSMMAKTTPVLDVVEGLPTNAFSGLNGTAYPSELASANLDALKQQAISAGAPDVTPLPTEPINISTGATGFPQSPEVLAGKPAIGQISPIVQGKNWASNLMNLVKNPSIQGVQDYIEEHPYATAAGAYGLYNMMKGQPKNPEPHPGMIRPYTFTRTQNPSAYTPSSSTAERTYFNDTWTAGTPYKAPGPEYKAEGGLLGLAVGGPVEQMSAVNAVGENNMYPQANLQTSMYSNPMVQRPMPSNVIKSGVDVNVDPYTGEQRFAGGGLSNLGDYSDGGRLLKGPGDGVSDSIPAVIGNRQPARLADGEFVVPARIVSELGNGSTEAGARKLYSMMDRVQKARSKTTGKGRVAANTKADKYLPA